MHLKTALFGLNFDAFEYSWDETDGATRIGLALLYYTHLLSVNDRPHSTAYNPDYWYIWQWTI